MKMASCRSCGNSIWNTTKQCPVCGTKQRGARANVRRENTAPNARDVSGLYLLLFGFFYLKYKGWHRAALAHFLMCFFMMGTMWLALPFFAKRFVDYFEEL